MSDDTVVGGLTNKFERVSRSGFNYLVVQRILLQSYIPGPQQLCLFSAGEIAPTLIYHPKYSYLRPPDE